MLPLEISVKKYLKNIVSKAFLGKTSQKTLFKDSFLKILDYTQLTILTNKKKVEDTERLLVSQKF